MTGNERINAARQFVADAMMGEGKDFAHELAEIGIDIDELRGTSEGAVEGFFRSKMAQMPEGTEVAAMDETDFMSFFIGSFLVGFVAGRWEENDEQTFKEMMGE
jgi:hypothetical protein